MHNIFVIDRATEALLQDATILIDTNVIFDAWKFKIEFFDLLTKFRISRCYLATTKAVVCEFLGGTKNIRDLEDKIQFLEVTFAKSIDTKSSAFAYF